MISTENSSVVPEASFQAETALGAGRGALILAIAGPAWLSWALVESHAFDGIVGPVFGCAGLLLVAGSVFAIRRSLRQKYAPLPSLMQRAVSDRFFSCSELRSSESPWS